MIPILYKENETDFYHNGLGLLVDTIYCYPEETRNGSYELELTYPVKSFLYEEIKANRWIKAKANDRYEAQLFRIYYISKPINGSITVKAEHISYLLKDNFIEILNYTGNCNGILNALNNTAAFATGFNFYSDVTATNSFSFDLRNFWECIIGKDDSVISQFGTGIDIVRNNKNISLLNSGGENNNVLIAYKKNLTGFTLEEDWTGCITKIYPYATQNDVRITVPEKYVNSQYINRDPNPRIDKIDFTNEFADGETITTDTLRQKAINYFINTQCDVPNLNYNIEFVALSKTEEYKNFAMNEGISLFDYVIVRHELYNIDTKIKVIKSKYDSLVEMYIKLELGFIKNTITNLLKDTNKKIDDTDKKVDDTKTELKEDIQDANEKTDNIKVVLEAKDTEIEASITNEVAGRKTAITLLDGKIDERVKSTEFEAYQTITDREIDERVSKGTDFYAEMLMHPDAIVNLIHGITDNKTTLDSNGFTVTGGGFTFEDNDGNKLIQAISSGGMRLGDSDWSVNTTMDMINLGGLPLSQYFMLSKIYINGDLDMGQSSSRYDIKNIENLYAQWGEFVELHVDDTLYVGDLSVSGSKNCVQSTINYGERLINAYETADYYFGDIGSGKITNGECLISIDPIFQECINTDIEYHVFTQVYNGVISKIERYSNYFIVYGEENTKFSWEIKAKRKGFEKSRLELSKNY